MSDSKPYCGIGTPAKGKKLGTMKDCVQQNQVRRFGLNKISKKDIEVLSKGKEKKRLKDEYDRSVRKWAQLSGQISKYRRLSSTIRSGLKGEEKKKAEQEQKEQLKILDKLILEREKVQKRNAELKKLLK